MSRYGVGASAVGFHNQPQGIALERWLCMSCPLAESSSRSVKARVHYAPADIAKRRSWLENVV